MFWGTPPQKKKNFDELHQIDQWTIYIPRAIQLYLPILFLPMGISHRLRTPPTAPNAPGPRALLPCGHPLLRHPQGSGLVASSIGGDGRADELDTWHKKTWKKHGKTHGNSRVNHDDQWLWMLGILHHIGDFHGTFHGIPFGIWLDRPKG